MKRLQTLMPCHIVTTTNELNINPLYLEAVAFAWLAEQRILEKSTQLKKITGASKNSILGAIYLP
jgi:anhydro-N-acetylmuramic acid kinase